MAKMNEIECIRYCENAITEMWEKYGKLTDRAKYLEIYENCKTVCMNNGYTGMCFVDIWNKASKKAHGE